MANKTATATASSSISIDTKTPTSTIDNLKDNYNSYDFIVSWKASDSDSGASGVEKYDVNYKIGSSSDWMRLAKATTSTSTEFRYSTTTDNTIFFRARARDKAGNESKWSKIASTTVIDTKADHIVISEIYIDSTNDWIELYNPTDESIDMADKGYKIYRATQSGNISHYLKIGKEENNGEDNFPGGTTIIPANGYYLIVNKDATSTYKNMADALIGDGGFALTDNNTVYLATDTVSSSTDQDILDFVGYGQSSFYEGEGPAPEPTGTTTIERKVLATSIASKLATGSHKQLGNSYDTNNNNQDFVLQEKPNPQSSGNNNQEQQEDNNDFPINLAWPEINYDSQNTNGGQYVGQISGDATSSIFATSTYKIGRILVGDNYMYAASGGNLYSIELASKEKKQIYDQGGLAVIGENNIYLKNNKKITSIDKSDKIINTDKNDDYNWKFSAQFQLRDIHLSSQGDIFMATKGTCNTEDKYYKINSENGTTTWEKIGKGTVRKYYGTVLDEQDNFYLSISQRGRGEEEKFLSEDFLALGDEGKILWSYNRDKHNNPAMGANGLVAGSNEVTDMVIDADNNVYLMGGGHLVVVKEELDIEVDESAQNLVMGPAGKLYFGVDNKGIYVVD